MVGFQEVVIALLNGVSIGLSIALVAVGLTLIFGVMHVINFAHGEFYTLGAYFTLGLLGVVGNYWAALFIAGIFVVVISLFVERLTLAPIRNRDPIQSLIVTFGLVLVSEELIREVFGGNIKSLSMPVQGSLVVGPLSYPMRRIVVIVGALVVLSLVWLFLERTRLGIMIRASSQDIDAARTLGIPANRIYSFTFALSAFLAAIAAGFLAPIQGVYPSMGITVLLDAFIVVIVGGLGSIPGAILAALLIGFSRSFSVLWVPSSVALIGSFLILIVVLLLKPEGIFS